MLCSLVYGQNEYYIGNNPPLKSPASSGIVKTTGTGANTAIVGYADVVSLFSGTAGPTTYLAGDGTMKTIPSGATVSSGVSFVETNMANLFTDLASNCPTGNCAVTIASGASGYIPTPTNSNLVTQPNITFDCKVGSKFQVAPGSSRRPIWLQANNIRFQGCTFDNSNNSTSTDGGAANFITIGNNSATSTVYSGFSFTNCTFIGTSSISSSIDIEGNYGNGLEIDNVLISNNRFYNGGIFADSGNINSVRIIGNDITNRAIASGTALAIHAKTTGSVVQNILIEGNTIHDQGQFGVEIQGHNGLGGDTVTSTVQNVAIVGNSVETILAGAGTGFSVDTCVHCTVSGNVNNSFNFTVPGNVSCLEVVNDTDLVINGMVCNANSGTNTTWGSGISLNKSSRITVINSTINVGGNAGALYLGGSVNGTFNDDNIIANNQFTCNAMLSTFSHCIWFQNNAQTSTMNRISFHDNYVTGTSTTNGVGIAIQTCYYTTSGSLGATSCPATGYNANWDFSNNVFNTLAYGIDSGTSGGFENIADFRNRFLNIGTASFVNKTTNGGTTWHTTAW